MRQTGALVQSDRNFWIGLGLAAMLHLALFVTVGEHRPRNIGMPGGSDEAVSVEIVDASDLVTGSTGPAAADSPQVLPAPALPTPAPSPEAPAQPAIDAQAEPLRPTLEESTERAPAEPPPKPAAPEEPQKAELSPQDTAIAPQQEAVEPALEKLKPPQDKPVKEKRDPAQPASPKTAEQEFAELLRIDPADARTETPSQGRKSTGKPSAQREAKLDFSLPKAILQGGGSAGSNAAFSRPAGITRSGENDDFARAVIRALRETMPQVNLRGRVTVRLVLTTNGSLEKVEVLGNSGDSALISNVVYSTKQANFPIPPQRSKDVDRIFMVTYIYDR